MVIACANRKGGSAKSVTTHNLAAALAMKGHKVLAVDTDPQGNLAADAGVGAEPGLDAVLLDGEPISGAIQASNVEGLDVIAPGPDLFHFEREIGQPGAAKRLDTALAPLRRSYAFVFIDTPPSLGLLSLSAMLASNSYLVPTPASLHSIQGLGKMRRDVLEAGITAKFLGAVVTLVHRQRVVNRTLRAELRKALGDAVFAAEIPLDVAVEEAATFGLPVVKYAPSSRASKAYKALAAELLDRLESEE